MATLSGIAPGQRLNAIRFSPDGNLIAGGATAHSRGAVYVWRFGSSASPVERIPTRFDAEDVNFTPDGARLVIGTGWDGGGDLEFWDPATQQVVGSEHADAAIWTTTVSGDSMTLMTGSQASGVRLWQLPSGKPLGAPLNGLVGSVDTVDLSPDGRMAVGADNAGNVLLWDVASRSTIGDLIPGPMPGRFAAAMFTPNGEHVIVVSDTGQGWVWDVDPADWLAKACVVAGRNLTSQEWQQILPDRAYQPTC
jgi:WD40 repeat protein